MKIQVIAVSQETKPTAKGSYVQLEVTYKNVDSGKTDSKKIMSFSKECKKAFDVLKDAVSGGQYEITTVKNDKSGFWDWTDATPGFAGETPQAASKSPRSSYETPEERAQKQVYIVRQSSLSAAVALLKTEKNIPSTQDVIAAAKEFEAYVFASQPEFAGESLPFGEE